MAGFCFLQGYRLEDRDSFGFRDAWSVGMTADYLSGVGGQCRRRRRPGLTGVSAAAPIMFEVFRLLPASGHWFSAPYDELEKTEVCRQSGTGHRFIVLKKIRCTLPWKGSGHCPVHTIV